MFFLTHQISISHQPAVFYSHSKSAPIISHSQPNRMRYLIGWLVGIWDSDRTEEDGCADKSGHLAGFELWSGAQRPLVPSE